MSIRGGATRLLLAGLAAAVLGATAAAAATHTNAGIYAPFTTSGAPAVHVTRTVRGHCWTGSLAAARNDAWRCMSGNFIYDPCFSSSHAPGIVLCPATGPWSAATVRIRLTQRLPLRYANRHRPSTSGLPWALVTTAGWRCRLVTGATTVVAGRRANYACTGTKEWLWGAPSRGAQPWRIFAARINATRLRKMVAIRAAWF